MYENRKFIEQDIELESSLYSLEKKYEVACKEIDLRVKLTISLGKKDYCRAENLVLGQNERQIKEVKKGRYGEEIVYYVRHKEWKEELLKTIIRVQKEFYLSEEELLSQAEAILQNEFEHPHVKRQVCISDRRADAVIFIENDWNRAGKIIALEAKTDKDTYTRLYQQIQTYYELCDEVYLIIQDKKVPKELPVDVGIIRVDGEGTKVLHRAMSKRDSYPRANWWNALQQAMLQQAKITPKKIRVVGSPSPEWIIDALIRMTDNIQRKLALNQFITGWTTGGSTNFKLSAKHRIFNDEEQRFLKAFAQAMTKNQ